MNEQRSASPVRRALRSARNGADTVLLGLVRLLGARVVSGDDSVPRTGRWPSTRTLFTWNVLLTHSAAPGADGVAEPTYDAPWDPNRAGDPAPPEWVARVPDDLLDVAVETTRTTHAIERDRAGQVELKASRLRTPTVTLVAGAVTVGAFNLNQYAQTHRGVSLAAGILAGASAVTLLAAAVSTLDADARVGLYRFVDGEDVADGAQIAHRAGQEAATEIRTTALRHLLASEAIAAARAGWSAGRKLELVMRARAWLSRGLGLLLVALLLSGISIATNPTPAFRPASVVPTSTPSP